MYSLILSLILFFTKHGVDPIIPKSLAQVQATEEEMSLVVTYMAYESAFQQHPKPMSWDAKAGVSCGLLQEPCAFVNGHSVKEQVEYWLREYRSVGLASLDSSKKRAEMRSVVATKARMFAKVVMEAPHE